LSAAIFFPAQEATAAQTPAEQPPATAKPPETKDQPQPVPDTPKPSVIAPKKTAAKNSVAKKKVKKRLPAKENPVVVIKNGGTVDSQGEISSTASDQQAPEKRKNTNSLLNTTKTNLQNISGKQLSPDQQDMVRQIRNYMHLSATADHEGDIQGAYNLAVKAHLLSEELIKP
jgi:hypothetical protein